MNAIRCRAMLHEKRAHAARTVVKIAVRIDHIRSEEWGSATPRQKHRSGASAEGRVALNAGARSHLDCQPIHKFGQRKDREESTQENPRGKSRREQNALRGGKCAWQECASRPPSVSEMEVHGMLSLSPNCSRVFVSEFGFRAQGFAGLRF